MSRRHRLSQNLDKQMLKKIYSQYNYTQSQISKPNNSVNDYSSKQPMAHFSNPFTINAQSNDQTFLSSNTQNYKPDQISRAYNFLCNISQSGIINLSSLRSFLQEQGQTVYTGVEMISLLDKENKGYVSKSQFFGFFEKGVSGREAELPVEMKKDRQLVKTIDKHYSGLMKNFRDPDYCEYAAKQIQRFKFSLSSKRFCFGITYNSNEE